MMHNFSTEHTDKKPIIIKRSLVILFIMFICALFLFENKAQASDSQIGITKASSPNFYVSPSGNDNNNGTSSSTPWRSLQKVNSTSFPSGSVIAFEQGGEWYGELRVSSSNITITSYGTGEKPKIHGWKTLTGWVNEGKGVYSITDVSLLSTAKILSINDKIYNKGRYPKSNWLRTHSASPDASSSGWVASNDLPGSPNLSGADIVLNKNSWVIDVGRVSSHSGNTISYSGTSGHYQALPHHGFFFQNHKNFLTEFGDWMYDGSSKKLSMYFGSQNPNNFTVKVSSVEHIINIINKSNVVLQNLHLEGANSTLVRFEGSNCTNNTLEYSYLRFSGYNGVFCEPVNGWPEHITIRNNTIEDIKNNGIDAPESRNIDVENNVLRRIYLDAAGGKNGDFSGVAIQLGSTGYRSGNYKITGNRIYDVGYNGIRFGGSNVIVENNFIYKYNLVKIDGGGIYTFGKGQSIIGSQDVFTNRIIRRNIVSNPDYKIPVLTQHPNEEGYGIYLDQWTQNVVIEENILFDNSVGILYHNGPNNSGFNNLIYNSRSTGWCYRRKQPDDHQRWKDYEYLSISALILQRLYNLSPNQSHQCRQKQNRYQW
jgi:parallel beta-helix repeat protein